MRTHEEQGEEHCGMAEEQEEKHEIEGASYWNKRNWRRNIV